MGESGVERLRARQRPPSQAAISSNRSGNSRLGSQAGPQHGVGRPSAAAPKGAGAKPLLAILSRRSGRRAGSGDTRGGRRRAPCANRWSPR